MYHVQRYESHRWTEQALARDSRRRFARASMAACIFTGIALKKRRISSQVLVADSDLGNSSLCNCPRVFFARFGTNLLSLFDHIALAPIRERIDSRGPTAAAAAGRRLSICFLYLFISFEIY